jgi:hypothetical protein
MAKLEKELETSRTMNLKHQQTIFVTPVYLLTSFLETRTIPGAPKIPHFH